MNLAKQHFAGTDLESALRLNCSAWCLSARPILSPCMRVDLDRNTVFPILEAKVCLAASLDLFVRLRLFVTYL